LLDVPRAEAGKPHLCAACGTRFTIPRIATPPPQPQAAGASRWIYWTAAIAVTTSLIAILFLYSGKHQQPLTTIAIPTASINPAATTLSSTEPWWIPPPPSPLPPTTIAATLPATTTTVAAATLPTTAPMIVRLHPMTPTTQAIATLDDQIGQAIHDGVTFLLSKLHNGRLAGYDTQDDAVSGLDALAVYAILHAGEATNDLRISEHSPAIDDMLKVLKTLSMQHGPATYSRSLRAAALSVYGREEDRVALRTDIAWLLNAATNGAYTYEMPSSNQPRDPMMWDNSNSQYGALGVWAASDLGIEAPPAFWSAVQRHWLQNQLPNGQWAYSPSGNDPELSMTVAGITTLFVAQDQLRVGSSTLERPPFMPALDRGLKWLESEDHSVDFSQVRPDWATYNLYGLERAALASGFKYFGTHNWYTELATKVLALRQPDGSWAIGDPVIDTSFTLLFLSRGRHPIFMNKLRYDGFWANRPREISNLTRYASHMLQRPLNWQVVSLASDWTDWMDSPILFISGDKGPSLTDDDCDKLRSFAENGGLIFTHADDGSQTFNTFVADLSHRLFPQYALQDLPPTHDIYSTLFPIDRKPRLQGVSNGARLLLLHSPTDLNEAWQRGDWKEEPTAYELGLNVFIYATGKANFRNKLHTPLVAAPQVSPVGSVKIARLKYDGNWNPEPAAWPRFAKLFLGQTSITAVPAATDFQDLSNLDITQTPLAHLTGTADIHFAAAAVKAVHDYVTAGGVLLIDPAGGSPDFTQSVLTTLLPQAFPHVMLQPMSSDHPILAGAGNCMSPITLKLRPRAAELLASATTPLDYLTAGRGMLILSRCDLTTALLGTNTYPIVGYEPDVAANLIRNILLWTIER
jgi:hypothetical protein